MAIVLLVTTLASLVLLLVGLMGLLGRLPRNHFAGIRTSATLASDEAWYEGQRVGSAPMIFAAVAAMAMGLAVLPFVLADEVGDGVVAGIVIAQGVLVLTGAVAAGFVGNRAARQRV
jgi:hypothetical protein